MIASDHNSHRAICCLDLHWHMALFSESKPRQIWQNMIYPMEKYHCDRRKAIGKSPIFRNVTAHGPQDIPLTNKDFYQYLHLIFDAPDSVVEPVHVVQVMAKFTFILKCLRTPANRRRCRPQNFRHMLAFNMLPQITTTRPVL